jgi:thiamine-phosphate pyrophosphorylase
MEITNKKIEAGIYLVIDPAANETAIIEKLKLILEEPIAAVQIWDHFLQGQDIEKLINTITGACHKKNVPVLINNKWEWLKKADLDGVHFDSIPGNWDLIKQIIGKKIICGITCNNDLSILHWAADNRLDYISFCSMFPSPTSNSCDMVLFETIRKAKETVTIPVFLAGGITIENMPKLEGLPFNGIAVSSGIMNAENPKEIIHSYLDHLNKTK